MARLARRNATPMNSFLKEVEQVMTGKYGPINGEGKPKSDPPKTKKKNFRSPKRPRKIRLSNEVAVGIINASTRLEDLRGLDPSDSSRIEELLGKAERFNSESCLKGAERILQRLEHDPKHIPEHRLLLGQAYV